MKKTLKKSLSLILTIMMLKVAVPVNATETNDKIKKIQVALNENLITEPEKTIEVCTGDELTFKGEEGYIDYYLYANDELIDHDYRSNILKWIPDHEGIFNVKIVGDNDYNDFIGEENLKVKVNIKDVRAPLITSMVINNAVENSGNSNFNIKADTVAIGEGDIKYKYELSECTTVSLPTGYFAEPIRKFDELKNSEFKATIQLGLHTPSKVFKDDYYEYNWYILRVTAINDYGKDVKTLTFDTESVVTEGKEVKYTNSDYKLREIEDLNDDGKVDLNDIALAVSRYNCKSDSEEYKRIYDINDDGIINIVDIVKISKKVQE